jgi:hypothetical protein
MSTIAFKTLVLLPYMNVEGDGGEEEQEKSALMQVGIFRVFQKSLIPPQTR